MKVKILRILFWVFLSLGVVSIFLGVVVPLFFGGLVDDGLRDLWLKPDDYDKWGETPGDNEVKIVRQFSLFNITNLPDVLNGSKAKMTELPCTTFQEYSKMFNWNYTNKEKTDFSQKDAKDFIIFNYKTDLVKIPSNKTTVPEDAPVTSFNYLTYFNFYPLTHSPAPLYMIPTLYEVVNALEKDFYVMILAYVPWQKYFRDSTFTNNYFASQGFTDPTLWSDLDYGWNSWKTLKIWVECLLDYNKTGLINSFEKIQMRFQLDGLISLISPGSLLYELVQAVQADMLIRYETNDPVTLGQLQWSTGIVTLNLPLDLGRLAIAGSTVPLPSFLMMNQTFGTFPEEYFLQLVLNVSVPLFSQNTSELLKVDYNYPRKNYQSFLNLNNLGVLFTNTTAAKELFGFDELQINVSQKYLGSLVNFPVKAYNVSVDGYTLFLTKLSTNMLVSQTTLLRNDAYWSIPTLTVFSNFADLGVNCEEWLSKVNPSYSKLCFSESLGWNISTNSWYNLQVWMKAAFKNASSEEYQTLLLNISSDDLNELLYKTTPNIYQLTLDALESTSDLYKCKKSICNYDELFYLQWSSSKITLSPPFKLTNYVKVSSTMMTWLPKRYQIPIEWLNYGTLPTDKLVLVALNYNMFLNPGIVRLFLNSYFQGNLTATALKFQLPNVDYVKELYNYLIKLIPGLNFFQTRSYKQWMFGFVDPFGLYVKSLNIYQGGYPLAQYVGATATNTSEKDKVKPRNMVRSGRVDTKETKFYYEYVGSRTLRKYSESYDEYSPVMATYSYKDIWAEPIKLTGGDGGTYGTQIDDDEVLTVFISAVMRNVNLTYEKDTTHHGLDLSRFLPEPDGMKTAAKAPQNAKYYQLAHGFNGFMNLSSQFGLPVFISYKRCLECESSAQNMFDRYEYSGVGKVGKKITPDDDDTPYVEVEPLTGTGVNVYLNLEFRVGVYNDYFFTNFFEPVKGKGIYFPLYLFERKAELSKHQVEKFFGNLKFIQKLRTIVFLIGVIVGSAFIVFSLICVVLIYRSHKRFQSWSSPRNTTLKKFITMKEPKEFESEFRK
jgi:hypothetical protein